MMVIQEAEVEQPAALQAAHQRQGAGACPTCGAVAPQGFRFCGACGRALAATFAPMPGDVVTIVFIDLEGFSDFTSRKSAHELRDVIRVFNWLVREQVARHGGFEVKQLGDGFMLAFSNPARAVACTADILRATSPGDGTGLPPSLRVCAGLNSGDAIREGDDFFGHTVNTAARIAARARGGQILASESTRVLAGRKAGVEFVDIGRRRLRGAGRPRVFEVLWRD